MITIEVPSDIENNGRYDLLESIGKPLKDNRPFCEWIGIYFGLSDRLHFWLENHNIEYSLMEDPKKWYIVFEAKNDAMLFKLVFGGQ